MSEPLLTKWFVEEIYPTDAEEELGIAGTKAVYLAADVERVFKEISEYIEMWGIGHSMYCPVNAGQNRKCDCGAADAKRLLTILKGQP